ncbi:MAG: hypothetical protein JW760_04550 [Spirochaetales bacterium]|nr:hypothetical protein [Spirochaetales bacterium]
MKKPGVLSLTKSILLVLLLFLLCTGCETTPSPYFNARQVRVTDVFAGAGLFDLIVTSISLFDPDIQEDLIRSLLVEVNEDPDLVIYWVPSSNPDITNLSYQTALLNGSIVFSKYALLRSAASMKGSARAGMAAKTVEEMEEEEDYTLTEEEQAALKARAAELSDEERSELKRCFVYLSCAAAALVKVPDTSLELVKQTALFLQQPERLMIDVFALPATISQLFSVRDNLSSVGQQSKGLLKNVNANIVVLKAVLEVNREARKESQDT